MLQSCTLPLLTLYARQYHTHEMYMGQGSNLGYMQRISYSHLLRISAVAHGAVLQTQTAAWWLTREISSTQQWQEISSNLSCQVKQSTASLRCQTNVCTYLL